MKTKTALTSMAVVIIFTMLTFWNAYRAYQAGVCDGKKSIIQSREEAYNFLIFDRQHEKPKVLFYNNRLEEVSPDEWLQKNIPGRILPKPEQAKYLSI